MKFRKKPIVIDAVQWTGDNLAEVFNGLNMQHMELRAVWPGATNGCLYIRTSEGEMRADENDWIIRGVKGEVYPCKPDIFAATYEPAPPPPVNPYSYGVVHGQ